MTIAELRNLARAPDGRFGWRQRRHTTGHWALQLIWNDVILCRHILCTLPNVPPIIFPLLKAKRGSFVNGPYILSLTLRHNFLKLLIASTNAWKNYPKCVHCLAKHQRHKQGAIYDWNHKRLMQNAAMCTLSLCDVIGITRHLHIKLKSFSNNARYSTWSFFFVYHRLETSDKERGTFSWRQYTYGYIRLITNSMLHKNTHTHTHARTHTVLVVYTCIRLKRVEQS